MSRSQLEKPKIVIAKGSGELLKEKGASSSFSFESVNSFTEKLARASRIAASIGVKGIVVVNGAGNLVRGDELIRDGIMTSQEEADAAGRAATYINAVVIRNNLARLGVSAHIVRPANFGVTDITFPNLPEYDPEFVEDTLADGGIVVVAGGMGENNATTDAAALHWASVQADFGVSMPVVLKGSKYDGIYAEDPRDHSDDPDSREVSRLHRYPTIPASEMQSRGLGGVDRKSLEIMLAKGIGFRVYRDQRHDIEAALNQIEPVGTFIEPR